MTDKHDHEPTNPQGKAGAKRRTDFRLLGLAVAVLGCAGLITYYADRDGNISSTIDSEMAQVQTYYSDEGIDSFASGLDETAAMMNEGETYEVTKIEDVTDEYVSNIEPAAGEESADENVVVAEVNGKKIYRADVLPMMEQAMQGQMAQLGVGADQLFPLFLEQFVNGELVLQEAEKANIEEEELYKKQLEMTKEQVKRNVFLVKMADEKITEKEMMEMYKTEVEALPDVPEIKASHILVKEEEEAKAIIKEINEGADFAEVAKEKSTGPSGPNGGDLGYFAEGDMVPEFSEAAFKLKTGEVSQEPVKTQFGWHVIKVTDTRLRPKPAFEEVKDQIEEALRKKTLDDYLENLRETAEIKVYDFNGNPIEAEAPAAGDAE